MKNLGEILYNLREALFKNETEECLELQNRIIEIVKEYAEDPPPETDEAPK